MLMMILAFGGGMIGAIGQFTAADDPTGVLRAAAPILAVVFPFIVARVTNAEAQKRLKFGVVLALSLAVTVVSGLGMDWSDPGDIGAMLGRLAQLVGVAQTTYIAADMWATARLGRGLNDLEAMAPERGIGA